MRHFESFLLLFAFIMALLYYRLACYKKQNTARYISQQNIALAIPQRSYLSFFVRTVCLVAAWVLLTICLAKSNEMASYMKEAPGALPHSAAELPKIDEVAFVLDLSASMGAKDTTAGESRIEVAKEIISSLIEDLGGINASLTGFAGNTQTIVPDTLDYLYFRILMDSDGINSTGEAGTNLLAMVDTVQAKYVNSPYKKSVRVVVLTDGEDTGFLDMNDTSQKQAESVLLEHIAASSSETLQWEIIGLGSDAGAQVPGVMYNDKPVISQMKRDLLQRMAKTGRGHFYAEIDVPLTEICDSLLADIAGSSASQDSQVVQNASSYAPRLSVEILLLLAIASVLLFAALTLPQYEKRACL